MSLMLSVSGLRGVIGETLTPETVARYAVAFGEYCRRRTGHKPEIVLGRDGRVTGKVFANIISSSLLCTGADVRALGICPTPTIQIAVERIGAAGGISVTASHNPMQWNGMKFVGPSGMFLDAEENADLWAIADARSTSFAAWDALGMHMVDDTWLRKHIDTVLELQYVDKQKIRSRGFKVVVDCINTAGGAIVPTLLEELGCSVIRMNCDGSGVFARTPEPLPENLTALSSRVVEEKADMGIAVDPDVDRLVFVTDKGEPFVEENTIATAVLFILEHAAKHGLRDARVVVNLSTTRAVDDIAAKFGAEVIRTPVGEINVAKRMKAVGAIIGGEGSGGVILPAAHLGRDALVGIGLILQKLAEFNGSISDLKESLPRYSIAKEKVAVPAARSDGILAGIKSSHNGSGRVNTDDGLKIDFSDSWVHMRKSNTEPIIRVIAEARTLREATQVAQRFKEDIQALTLRETG